MHPKSLECIPLGLNAMERGFTELLNEYRIALDMWS